MEFKRNVLLNKFTSFKTGGPANYFCSPKNKAELKQSLAFARKYRLPVAAIGAGANLLVSDQGYSGMVIHISDELGGIELISRQKYHLVKVGAGVRLQKLVRFLLEKGIVGLEFMAGIPGTIGGAVVMNAGAWGEEIGNYIKEVKAIDRNGKERAFKQRDLKFSYRKSKLTDNRWIVVEAIFKLHEGDKKESKSKIRRYLGARKKKQPAGLPSFGSVFKNPAGFFAGKLIEDAGCKGFQIGGAQVSSTHANFIVNLGSAKTKDALDLISAIQARVKEKYNILLEPEVLIMVD
jgi:UDP-N-acetylmuramate dehydrogenase